MSRLLLHQVRLLNTHGARALNFAQVRRVGVGQQSRRGRLSMSTLNTPFISDTIPLAEGVLGTVEELLAEVGQSIVSKLIESMHCLRA